MNDERDFAHGDGEVGLDAVKILDSCGEQGRTLPGIGDLGGTLAMGKVETRRGVLIDAGQLGCGKPGMNDRPDWFVFDFLVTGGSEAELLEEVKTVFPTDG